MVNNSLPKKMEIKPTETLYINRQEVCRFRYTYRCGGEEEPFVFKLQLSLHFCRLLTWKPSLCLQVALLKWSSISFSTTWTGTGSWGRRPSSFPSWSLRTTPATLTVSFSHELKVLLPERSFNRLTNQKREKSSKNVFFHAAYSPLRVI